MNVKKLLPLFFIIISILYIAFSLSIEQRRMIGDVGGWDPGSRAMPLGIGILMLLTSTYQFFKESIPTTVQGAGLERSQRKLIIFVMITSFFYIIIFRLAGFIIATNVYLYSLIFFNHKKEIKCRFLPDYFIGLISIFIFGLIIYSIARYTIRFLFLVGKKNSIEVFTGRLLPAFISIAITYCVILLLNIHVKKLIKSPNGKIILASVIFASIVTQTLYIIFRQIFWVNLVNGIVFW